MKIDFGSFTESDRRRPDFCPGVPVTLGDGLIWSLPSVRASRTTWVGPGGASPGVIFRVGDPSDDDIDAAFQENLDARITHATPQEINRKCFGIGLAFGGVLLRRNYRLDDSEIEHLLMTGFWKRSLEDRQAFTDATNAYNTIRRIALDQPMASLTKIMSGFPRTTTSN